MEAMLAYVATAMAPLLAVIGGASGGTGIWSDPLRVVGAITLGLLGIRFLRWFLEKLTRRRRNPRTYGKWAIVTGATSGIGEAFANELAAKGMSVLIVSRTPAKLESSKAAIKKHAPTVDVETLAFDFTRDGAEADVFYAELAQVAERLDKEGGIGLLVNNVGMNTEIPEYFQNISERTLLDMVRTNVDGTVRMTRAILPLMIKRQKGAIINVSSGSGNHPTPLLSTYAATKAFINEFSRSIHYEAREAGVDVLCVTPYYVSSNMYKKEPGFMVASARRVVRDTLALVGRYDIAAPYFWHGLQGWLFDSYWATPQALMKSLKRNRDRALKMKASSAANSPAAASAAQSTSGA